MSHKKGEEDATLIRKRNVSKEEIEKGRKKKKRFDPRIKSETEKIFERAEERIAAGGEAGRVFDLPAVGALAPRDEPRLGPTIEAAAKLPVKKEAPTEQKRGFEVLTDEFGNKTGVRLPDGRVLLGLSEKDVELFERKELGKKPLPGVETAQQAAARREQEAARASLREGALSAGDFAKQFVTTEEAEPINISLADARRGAALEAIYGVGGSGIGAALGAKVLAESLAKKGTAAALGGPALMGIASTWTAVNFFNKYTTNLKGEHLEDIQEVSQVITAAVGRGFSTIQSEVRRGGLTPEQGQIILEYIDAEIAYAERLVQEKRMTQGEFVKEIVDTDARLQLAKIRSYRTKYRVILVQAIAEAKAGLLDPNSPMLVFDQEEFNKGGFEE